MHTHPHPHPHPHYLDCLYWCASSQVSHWIPQAQTEATHERTHASTHEVRGITITRVHTHTALWLILACLFPSHPCTRAHTHTRINFSGRVLLLLPSTHARAHSQGTLTRPARECRSHRCRQACPLAVCAFPLVVSRMCVRDRWVNGSTDRRMEEVGHLNFADEKRRSQCPVCKHMC